MTCKKRRSTEQEPEPQPATAATMAHPQEEEERTTTNPLGPTTLLPYDNIKDILSRLPVQTLTRFEAVSKPFLALINSPEFAAAHLDRASRRPAILLRRFHNPSGSNFSFSFIDPGSSVLREIRVPFIAGLVRFPKIVGSSGGLLCLDVSPCYASGFILWNVATGRFRDLPRPCLVDAPHFPYWMVAAGFAHHPSSGDFVLVRLASFKTDPNHFHESRAEVFSWKTGSWKVVDRSLTEPVLGPVSVSEGQTGVLVNGTINWVANGVEKLRNRKFVVCYDMGREEFRRVLGPDIKADVCVKVMEFKESLALALYPSIPVYPFDAARGIGLGWGIMDQIELWVPEDRDGNHWTKLHSFQGPLALSPGSPLGIWNDCELIVKRQEGQCISLFVMDPWTQTVRKFPICPAEFSCDIFRYVESLVPVSGCAFP